MWQSHARSVPHPSRQRPLASELTWEPARITVGLSFACRTARFRPRHYLVPMLKTLVRSKPKKKNQQQKKDKIKKIKERGRDPAYFFVGWTPKDCCFPVPEKFFFFFSWLEKWLMLPSDSEVQQHFHSPSPSGYSLATSVPHPWNRWVDLPSVGERSIGILGFVFNFLFGCICCKDTSSGGTRAWQKHRLLSEAMRGRELFARVCLPLGQKNKNKKSSHRRRIGLDASQIMHFLSFLV